MLHIREKSVPGKINYGQYKNGLRNYLGHHGVDVNRNPTFCFSPTHENVNTPALIIHDDHYECKACGIHGDIYDACGIILGVTNRRDQYEEIERHFGGNQLPAPKNVTGFSPSPSAEKQFQKYFF